MAEVTSSYCWLIFLIPAIASLCILIAGKSKALSRWLALAGMLATFAVSAITFFETQSAVLTALGNRLRMDSLSGLVSGLISLVGLIVIVYSFGYVDHAVEQGTIAEKRVPAFYWQVMLFIATMLFATTTNNIIMLWVIIEATTLASALLVAFYWNKNALEAGYKYLMLLTVGISFALFGCVLLYSGVASHVGDQNPLLLTVISPVVKKGLISGSIILLAAAFFIVGFGTKAGAAPFHAWLPDAHAEAPTPVSALLSGVMIKVGIYALVRTVAIFYTEYSVISLFVTILGIFTMIVGVLMMLLQEDLKRFLAYSSVNQVGFILMGLGLAGGAAATTGQAEGGDGAYLGMYGALFHMVNHGIIKSLLFLSAGAVIYATGARRISELGGLSRRMPITGFCFLIAGLSIAGVPLLNGFMSKFTLFLAGAKSPAMLWTTIIAIICSILSLAIFVDVTYRMFMGPLPDTLKGREIKEVPASMWAGMFVLCLLCFVLGVYPQLLYPMLDNATRVVLAVMSRGGI